MAATRRRAGPRDGQLSTRSRIATVALIALVLTSCGGPQDDGTASRSRPFQRALTPAERDSVKLLDEERAGAHRDPELAARVRPLLEDWEEAWSRVIPGFQLDELRWQKHDTLAPVASTPLANSALDSLTQRRWKLAFTADRWLAVDPDFKREFTPGGGFKGSAEPRVSIYDFRARRVQVLDQRPEGTPLSVAGWISERQLVVAGWQPWDGDVKQIRPAVWLYDLVSLHRTTGMGPPVSEPELEAHQAMLELLIRKRNAPARRP